jgi:hypothetical protein
MGNPPAPQSLLAARRGGHRAWVSRTALIARCDKWGFALRNGDDAYFRKTDSAYFEGEE